MPRSRIPSDGPCAGDWSFEDMFEALETLADEWFSDQEPLSSFQTKTERCATSHGLLREIDGKTMTVAEWDTWIARHRTPKT